MKHARNDYNDIQDPQGRIADDEPVFLLRAKDKIAPTIVRAWAKHLKANGGDKVTANRAVQWATEMERWQKENGCKMPDTPPEMFPFPEGPVHDHFC